MFTKLFYRGVMNEKECKGSNNYLYYYCPINRSFYDHNKNIDRS